MLLSEVIKELQHVQEGYGDIECDLQVVEETESHPGIEKTIVGYERFFIVPEEYENGFICNIRTFPY